MTAAITPEVMGLETQILEDSPMTDSEEKELVIVKTAIKTAYADKLERDLAIGAGLLQIFRRKLYRGKEGGRTWEQWLAEESADLTSGRGSIGKDTAHRLRGFYLFRVEMLQEFADRRTGGIPLPTSPMQVRPLLGFLDGKPSAAIKTWKAAVSDAKGKVPTFDQVNRAALAYKANAANEARRLSNAQQAPLQKAMAVNRAAIPTEDAVSAYIQKHPDQALADFKAIANHAAHENCQPHPYSDKETPSPTISAWEMEKEDTSLDAGAECKRITHAINDAHKAIGMLRGILYSQINRHGSDYLVFLRQVDAGVYSLHNIDSQVEQMSEDIDFISELLTADVGEGELAQSTVDVASFPTRA